MAHKFPSEDWTSAYKDAVNNNAEYAKAGKDWTFGAVAFVVSKDPTKGLDDDMGMLLDVGGGKCHGTKYVKGLAAVESAPFIIVAPYERWKECIRGEFDPIQGMMQGKLKLTKGHLPTMLRFVESSRQLVFSAAKVDTQFTDDAA